MIEKKSENAYFSMFLVKVQLSLVIDKVMVALVIHHRVGIENKLQVDSSRSKADFSVSFSASIGKSEFSFFLRPVAESRVTYLILI